MAYITPAQATTLIANFRPDLVSFTGALLPSHLEFASLILDQKQWIGSRASSTQDGAWPRKYVPIDPFDSSLGYRDSTTTPVEIQRVVAELAIRFSRNPAIVNDSSSGLGLTGLSLPDTKYFLLGDHIDYLIQPYLSYPDGQVYRVD